MELWEYISKRLGITHHDEIECVKNITVNVLVLNEHQTGDMDEEKLDTLVKLTGVYLNEALKVMQNPRSYKRKTREMNSKFMEIIRDGRTTAAV